MCTVDYTSRLSDLNQLPARYEGAALPGELSRRIYGLILGRRGAEMSARPRGRCCFRVLRFLRRRGCLRCASCR